MEKKYDILSSNQVLQKKIVLSVKGRYNVIVCGGGVTGIAAAISAARSGANTILIEGRPFLGGVATGAMMAVFWIPYECAHGFVKELFDRLIEKDGAMPGPVVPFDPEVLKRTTLEMIRESGSNLLLYTNIVDVVIEQNQVKGIVIESKAGREVILGDIVIDATGDADIAALAGAPFTKGREADGKMRPVTSLFRVGNINVTELLNYIKNNPWDFSKDPNKNIIQTEIGLIRLSGFFELVKQARTNGELGEQCYYLRVETVSPKTNMAIINTTRVYGIDGTNPNDLTQAQIEMYKQTQQLISFLKKYVPGFSDCFLIDTSPYIGVRETRRILGEYKLSADDIINDKRFNDEVVRHCGRLGIGEPVHSPDGHEGGPNDDYARRIITPIRAFSIPYRCLIPKKIEGLIVAGRSISVDHDGDIATRIMPCCTAMGQAAGIAASICNNEGVFPRKVNVQKIRHELFECGVNLDIQPI